MLRLKADTLRRALFEAAVIAVGVFLALAADNWNDDRKDRQLEQDFLDGIALDLERNKQNVEIIATQATRLKASLERMVSALNQGEAKWTNASDFVRDLVYCTYLGLPELSSVSYDELRSTGSMRLIRDQQFKRKLADYYGRFDRAAQFHTEYRRKEAAVEEALVGYLPLRERLIISEEDGEFETNVDPQQWIAELNNRPELVARLEDMVWVQSRIITRYTWVIEEGNSLLADIQSMRP
jgi:hypothetical protein